ncbi:MAG: hypothetical protein QOH63_2001 [Acidobacteriota bacterium]|jgi:hypothetical protein|nr:hypothetical protein [Acidobacteriota bacterium]
MPVQEISRENNSLDEVCERGDNALENISPDEYDLIRLLCGSLAILWKDWPRDMKVSVLDSSNFLFSLVGECPHCRSNSVFIRVAQHHAVAVDSYQWMVYTMMQCQGCQQFILGIVFRHREDWRYVEHYPLGTPDDSVHEKVPTPIAEDFSESKRCLWVKAYRASVAMCRRAVQSSCDDLGAQGGNLFQQIDDLAKKGIITEPLRQLAHKVRLVANKELHAKHDDLGTIKERDAKSIIAFTQEYFHHVYVMPALLTPAVHTQQLSVLFTAAQKRMVDGGCRQALLQKMPACLLKTEGLLEKVVPHFLQVRTATVL